MLIFSLLATPARSSVVVDGTIQRSPQRGIPLATGTIRPREALDLDALRLETLHVLLPAGEAAALFAESASAAAGCDGARQVLPVSEMDCPSVQR